MKTEYHSRLPHIVPVGATEFVTFTLWDAIPTQIIIDLKEEYEIEVLRIENEISELDLPQNVLKEILVNKLNEARWQYYLRTDEYLDNKRNGANYLKEAEISLIVEKELKALDGRYYDLIAYCIMSNHVHVLFDLSIQLPENFNGVDVPDDYYPLHKIMKKIKGSTAFYANKHLQLTGQFWMKDSYDHYIRNENEMANIVSYILNNPVKAGLCNDPDDWRFSFCKYD